MNINFQPIFDYIDESQRQLKDYLNGELSNFATKSDIKELQNSIDFLAKSNRDIANKVIVQENKTKRIEHWVIKTSSKIKVPYKP